MLKGRLGLARARVPYKDRHGLMSLSRGHLKVTNGALQFEGAKGGQPGYGVFDIPVQALTCVLLGPGSTVSHDALRLLARQGTGLVAVGDDGVRMYASMPFGPDRSALARSQVRHWMDVHGARVQAARRMYAWRLGEVLPATDLASLRGMEGARAKEMYRILAKQYGVPWSGRRYDRADPTSTDPINMAINHASVAVIAAAGIAVAATATIPQLGFIHEDSGQAFCLDVADLYRDEVTLPAAFSAVALQRRRGGDIEHLARRRAGRLLQEQGVIPAMIDRIKLLFEAE